MSEEEYKTEEENETKNLQFFSQKSIGIATFIGGPMAAGYLMRENYRSLEQPGKGKNALVLGIIATVLLLLGIFSIPESFIDKVPNQIIPLIYTGLIMFMVGRIHGPILDQHKENGNEFHSGWKAAGIGGISMLILIAGIFGYTYLSTDNELLEQYDKEMQTFTLNEKEGLKVYDDLGTKFKFDIINTITEISIPKWNENIEVVKRTNKFENLPEELRIQNETLLEYCRLRIEGLELLRKAVREDTDRYDAQLNDINLKIDNTLKKLD